MTDEFCVFCKIVANEIPAKIVAESELALAFEDIAPQQPLHILVVPKQHYSDVADLVSNDEAAFLAVSKLATKIASEMSTGHFRLTFNTGAEAGQTVFHAHAHVTSKTLNS
jgi:histidine triad (HIT) family protein